MQGCIGATYTATQSTLELSPKVQDCIGVTYTATQSILGLLKLEVNYSSTSFQKKCKITWALIIQQLSQHWNYFSKSARLHRSHLYSNSINTGTIPVRSQLFINFISAKVQDCIGGTYTAAQHWNYLS